MADNGFNSADMKRAKSLGFFIAKECCADCLCLYWISGGCSSAMGLKVLRSILFLINVQTGTSVAIPDQGYLGR